MSSEASLIWPPGAVENTVKGGLYYQAGQYGIINTVIIFDRYCQCEMIHN